MQKEIIRKTTRALPNAIKEVSKFIKTNFQTSGHKALMNAGGTVGLIIQLFGNSIIESYFSRIAKKKLDDYGTQTYLAAAFEQAEKSLNQIKDKIENEESIEESFETLENALNQQVLDYDESEILIVFQPKYHPAVLYVKDRICKILAELKVTQDIIDEFIKHYNSNIGIQVKRCFGEEWEDHLEDIAEMRYTELETDFLWDMKCLDKIGFRVDENLKYETAYAQWKPISEYQEIDDIDFGQSHTETEEALLEPVEKLMDDYFDDKPNDNINKILFILGDFGKGKSIFLKQYASKLAKEYLETGEGNFPVYFNLRQFHNYSSEYQLGVVADFLLTDYGIKIDDPHFINKNYIFLIDSLDESGDLSQNSIEKVINSVQAIQNLDKTKYRTNRIVIASRPFDGGLSVQLKNHKPYTKKNAFGKKIAHFISLYGFTKLQFNDWLIESLINHNSFNELKGNSLTKKIRKNIAEFKYIDVYNELLKNDTLSRSELRRPIFAYMIFKLLLSDMDFYQVGKIGVYLSFINLLTREAKYIESETDINLNLEFEFRNILHSIAALSMYEWQKNKHLELKKADICRTLDGEITKETDSQILARYKKSGITDIEFLSHSYFGENNNILHFQHKSFAEILLAEYYLKLFIKYALDEDFDIAQARIKLSIGMPSSQTVLFLIEMLRLLRASSSTKLTNSVLQKRKLLFPLLASLSTNKNNNLFCYDIYYEWFKKFKIPANSAQYPEESITNWYFTQEKIDKIIKIAQQIIESNAEYILVKGEAHTALFDKEVFETQENKLRTIPPNIDKWLALLVGNVLQNNETRGIYFNSKLTKIDNLFEMVRNWNYYSSNDSAPFWAKPFFKGIDMKNCNEEFIYQHINVSGIDFSHSNFKNINLSSSKINGSIFRDVSFEDVDFSFSDLSNSIFYNIREIIGNLDLGFTMLNQGVFVPPQLAAKFFASGFMGNHKCFIAESGFSNIHEIFDTLQGLIQYGIDNQLFDSEECASWFQFDNMKTEETFDRKLAILRQNSVTENNQIMSAV